MKLGGWLRIRFPFEMDWPSEMWNKFSTLWRLDLNTHFSMHRAFEWKLFFFCSLATSFSTTIIESSFWWLVTSRESYEVSNSNKNNKSMQCSSLLFSRTQKTSDQMNSQFFLRWKIEKKLDRCSPVHPSYTPETPRTPTTERENTTKSNAIHNRRHLNEIEEIMRCNF